MKKNVYLVGYVLLALQCFWACSDNEEGINPSTLMQIYGQQYNISSGVIWKNNPNEIISTIPYVYEDIYTNKSGQTITDNVTGFTIGPDTKKVGNFMLSLYEDGFTFNESLQTITGRGVCVSFHLSSSDPEKLILGKYVYGNKKEANTFAGYSSSDYNMAATSTVPIPAEITEGEVTIEETNGIYSVVFHCKTSFGGELSGEYRGVIRECRVPQVASGSLTDVSLAGLLDTITIQTYWGGEPDPIRKDLDRSNGAAFLPSASGICQKANAAGKEKVDIALVWDKKKEAFYFESPIRMRSLLGHDNAYNFPCHTIYMKAPDSFTETDYDKLEETGFSFEIREEKVEIPISSFQPGFVFFQAGNGVQGVIHVKDYTPLGTRIETIGYQWYNVFPANPTLKLDIKCPANFTNPQIR